LQFSQQFARTERLRLEETASTRWETLHLLQILATVVRTFVRSTLLKLPVSEQNPFDTLFPPVEENNTRESRLESLVSVKLPLTEAYVIFCVFLLRICCCEILCSAILSRTSPPCPIYSACPHNLIENGAAYRDETCEGSCFLGFGTIIGGKSTGKSVGTSAETCRNVLAAVFAFWIRNHCPFQPLESP
jgi:hypothetical protein